MKLNEKKGLISEQFDQKLPDKSLSLFLFHLNTASDLQFQPETWGPKEQHPCPGFSLPGSVLPPNNALPSDTSLEAVRDLGCPETYLRSESQ